MTTTQIENIIKLWNSFTPRKDIEAEYDLHPMTLTRILKANGLSGKRPSAKEQQLAAEMATLYERDLLWKKNNIQWTTIDWEGTLLTVSTNGEIWNTAKSKPLRFEGSTKGGYHLVGLKGKSYYVHRIIATTFISNPLNLDTVDHINSNKSNNSVWNLQWMSLEDNASKGNKGE